MIYHPGIIILLATAFLIFARNQEKLFKAIAISAPIIAFVFSSFLEADDLLYFLNIKFISVFSASNILVAYGLQFALLAANIFNCNISKSLPKLEIICGSAYAGLTQIALFAGDFISLFTALELMMICSTILIYSGHKRGSINSAGWYFITHLFSGSLILIGVAYIHSQTGTYQIFNLNEFANQSSINSFFAYVILLGALINIASFPFCGWMVNYYAEASNSGFVYLISFTSKVSLVVIIKLFAGWEILQYIAIATIIYASLCAITAENIFKLLSLLSILQIGFMLYVISYDNHKVIDVVYLYLLVHIIYKALVSVTLAYVEVTNISQITRIKNIAILSSLLISLGIMINLPFTTSSVAKLYITSNVHDNLLNYLSIYINLVIILALPFKQYWQAKGALDINFDKIQSANIYWLSAITLIIGILGSYPLLGNNVGGDYLLKQSLIIGSGLIGNFLLSISRNDTKTFNLIEWLGNILGKLINQNNDSTESKGNNESWSFVSLEKQIMTKLAILHDQQTAVFIVFTIFIIVIVSFQSVVHPPKS